MYYSKPLKRTLILLGKDHLWCC